MKNVTAHIRLVFLALLGLAFLVPGVAHPNPNSAQTRSQREAQKWQKKYMKQQRKEQKKTQKSQTKAMKDWKKQHPTAH